MRAVFNIGPGEFALIAVVALLVFGPGRIPAVARSLARGYRELLKLRRQIGHSVDEIKKDLDLDLDLDPGLDGLPDPARLLRQPSAPRVDASGETHQRPPLLPVPEGDDYLAAAAEAPGKQAVRRGDA